VATSHRQPVKRVAAMSSVMAVAFFTGLAGAQERIEITGVWTSEEVGGLLLASVNGVAETPRGMIWVSDTRVETVYSVNPRADTFTSVARSGEGPGEVEGPDRIAIMPDGNMAVFDFGKIEIITPEGRPVRRVRLPVEVSWPKGFAVLPSGGFAISGGIYSIDAAIHEFGSAGELVRSWADQSPALEFRARIVGSGGALFAGAGGLLYSQSAPHRITEYDYAPGDDPEGRILADLPEMLVHPGDEVIVESGAGPTWRRSFHPYFPQSRAVFELPGGRILNVVVYKDDGYSVWQLFGSPGERSSQSGLRALVAEGRADQAYVPWFLCDDGTILATRLTPTTDVPIVVRLQVR